MSLPRTPLSLSGERAEQGAVPRVLCGWGPWGGITSAEARPLRREHRVSSSPPEPSLSGGWVRLTHRWAGQAGESSLTTLPRETDDAPLTSQTLGARRTVRTLGEKGGDEKLGADTKHPPTHTGLAARSSGGGTPSAPPAPAPRSPDSVIWELRTLLHPGPGAGPRSDEGLTEGPSSPGSPFSPGSPAGPWRPGSPARPGGPLSPRAPLGPSFPEGPGGPGGPGLP